jgi:predicted dehydrogenase
VRVAIVGCGRAGAQHAAAAAAAGGRVLAVCDLDPEAARNLSSSLRTPVRDFSDLLGDPMVDVMGICTDPRSHLELGLRSLAAGKAAVIEKPPALSPRDVEELEAASGKYRRPLAVMLQHRARLPEEAFRKEWSANASAVVEVFRHRPRVHYASTWRGDPVRSGGGFFAHLAVHYVDLACQLLGEPEWVRAIVETAPGVSVDVRAALALRMGSGALLTVHASSLPAARQERLHVLDGERFLTVTGQETRYGEGGREIAIPAPSTADLRAAVYGEVAGALRSGKPVHRFGVGAAVGSVAMAAHVAEALENEAPPAHPGRYLKSGSGEPLVEPCPSPMVHMERDGDTN